MPALLSLSAGAEFEYSVSANCTDELYQGCGRVQYDPTLMQPVSALRGQALPAGYLFTAKLDAVIAASDGQPGLPALAAVIPFAFTGLPGSPSRNITAGELFRLRFRLLRTPDADSAVRLLNTAQYLQLRGTKGDRLAFDLASEVTGK
jgi:hypothetical protein